MEVNEIRLDRMTNAYLSQVYECVCEEYRQRLCKQWDLDCEKQSGWVCKRVGETLVVDIVGGFAINMEDVRLIVENGIGIDAFMQYVEYYTWSDGTSPNIRNWFLGGYRGEKGGVG